MLDRDLAQCTLANGHARARPILEKKNCRQRSGMGPCAKGTTVPPLNCLNLTFSVSFLHFFIFFFPIFFLYTTFSITVTPPLTSHSNPCQIPQKIFPHKIHNFHLYFSYFHYNFSQISPLLSETHSLSLSKILTSIIEDENRIERNLALFFHLCTIKAWFWTQIPKKLSKASLCSQAPSRTKSTKDAYPLILPPSARGLIIVNEEQRWSMTL